ncbi:hypothetical protein P799_03695 [Lysinibacillus sphaericus CBAM5]|uniref:Uncharacterized protein n=2 Tax=Lysinibacillus sphaericus TaxID=1421 RepID=B1HR15_LYSSC|nr:hypothetical protein Bsph_1608 [Lysinibacillus sphaericus C3-41]EWH34873.1 hypothetical protein P799_03695 [Lysinibacillus sphaericus CBAM5]
MRQVEEHVQKAVRLAKTVDLSNEELQNLFTFMLEGDQ